MFLTAIEDFDYRPKLENGEIVRGWVVTESTLVWDDGGEHYTVPAGFETDLASLPSFIKPVLSKLGRHQRAAVLHDYLYRNTINSKSWADRQMNKAMKQDGVAAWRRCAIMSGLFAGGWIGWNKWKRQSPK